jgi:hypothetical protein
MKSVITAFVVLAGLVASSGMEKQIHCDTDGGE